MKPGRVLGAVLSGVLALCVPSACSKSSTYSHATLTEEVIKLCRKDYNLDLEARLVGKTFYVSSTLDGLVGRDLGLQQDALKKLEGAMLNTTRVALSSDAELNFLVVKARDSRLGVTVTLLRYFPDIKSLIYMRISRSDFEERLVLETDNSLAPGSPEEWKDVTITEFIARLSASRLQRQFSSNPLVSAFLQIHQVKGSYAGGILKLSLDKFESDPDTNLLVDEILRTAVEETVLDIVAKYNQRGIVKRVVVDAGRRLLDLDVDELFEQAPGKNKKESLFS